MSNMETWSGLATGYALLPDDWSDEDPLRPIIAMDQWEDFCIEMERFGVCKSIPVGHGPVIHNISDRCLHLFHVQSVGNIGNLKNQRGNVFRRGLRPEGLPDLLLQIL